ncbi:hypothetical protein FS749_013392 [Ceratobasidium sp. UAMH 11750]|nr:hypothetical protein FS749_013392 [Ceratobasidium sp. UAMH 11750]
MSSLPPRAPGSMFNRFAKRDPQLYPLAAIMLAVTATGGYFLAQKSQTHDPARAFGQVTPAWEAHKPGDNVSEWKTRFKTKRGTEGDFGSVLTTGEPVAVSLMWNLRLAAIGAVSDVLSSCVEPRSRMVAGGGVVLSHADLLPIVDEVDNVMLMNAIVPLQTNVNDAASTPKYNRLADRAHDLL